MNASFPLMVLAALSSLAIACSSSTTSEEGTAEEAFVMVQPIMQCEVGETRTVRTETAATICIQRQKCFLGKWTDDGRPMCGPKPELLEEIGAPRF